MADSMSLKLEITHNALPQIIEAFPLQAGLVVAKTAFDIKADAQDRAPRDLSDLANSIEANQQSPTQWTVDVTSEYGPPVEYGAAPHMPPVEELKGWAGRHQVDPWALAVAISRRGTDPQPFLTPAAERAREPFNQAMAQLLGRMDMMR